jgi:sulfur relay protein TusB/DsrH
MLVIIKSCPNTPESKRGVSLACDMSADIVFLQNGVYFAQGPKLPDTGFKGKAYFLQDDVSLRGLNRAGGTGIDYIDYDRLYDLIKQT